MTLVLRNQVKCSLTKTMDGELSKFVLGDIRNSSKQGIKEIELIKDSGFGSKWKRAQVTRTKSKTGFLDHKEI